MKKIIIIVAIIFCGGVVVTNPKILDGMKIFNNNNINLNLNLNLNGNKDNEINLKK